jgi:hypothetical protein
MEPVSRRSNFAPPTTPLTRRLLVYFRSGAYIGGFVSDFTGWGHADQRRYRHFEPIGLGAACRKQTVSPKLRAWTWDHLEGLRRAARLSAFQYLSHSHCALRMPLATTVEYDVDMTMRRLTRDPQAAYELQEANFQLLRGQRSGRMGPSNVYVRPENAKIDAQGRLNWKWSHPNRTQRLPPDLCFRFARLSTATDEEVRKFAARWGPLRIRLEPSESLAEWREYTKLAQSIFRQLTDERQVEDWKRICEWIAPGAGLAEAGPVPHSFEMVLIAAALNKWFGQARGNQILEIVGPRYQTRPTSATLFGALACQIAYKLSVADETVLCAGCATPFTPKRTPSRGARQYCPKCRRAKVPQRDAARDYRKRSRKTS